MISVAKRSRVLASDSTQPRVSLRVFQLTMIAETTIGLRWDAGISGASLRDASCIGDWEFLKAGSPDGVSGKRSFDNNSAVDRNGENEQNEVAPACQKTTASIEMFV